MKRNLLLLIALFGIVLAAGCSGGAGAGETTETVRNQDGEMEGKPPEFKMVPAQKDPNYQGKN